MSLLSSSHPHRRYRVIRNRASKQWEVIDCAERTAGNVLAGPFKTEAQADACKMGMCVAYWHAVDDVKYGGIIV